MTPGGSGGPGAPRSRVPDGTRVSDYDYKLPEGRIARWPAERRDASRLLVLPRGDGAIRHLRFHDLPELFRPGDLLVLNESRVLPARLLGAKPTGAPAEILLLRPVGPMGGGAPGSQGSGTPDPGGDPALGRRGAPGAGRLEDVTARRWEALVRPGSKLKPGRVVEVAPEFTVRILDSAPGGGRIVELDTPLTVAEALDRFGHVPLPPYLERDDEPADRARYQTVYARTPGSVAAPTAGLHFTDELLARLAEAGVERTAVTLHVGVGTFRPIDVDDPARHEMHTELYHVPATAVRAVDTARARGGRIWAVGTTVVRTLESAAGPDGSLREGSGATDLFIRPPFDFRVVQGLLTNFHLPRSTLLMLVAAVGGYRRVMDAYETAIRQGYRFYSYGDAMALPPAD